MASAENTSAEKSAQTEISGSSADTSCETTDQDSCISKKSSQLSDGKFYEYMSCQYCYRSYSSVDGLKRHIEIHEKKGDSKINKPIKCQICLKSYKTVEGLRYHVTRIHHMDLFYDEIIGDQTRQKSVVCDLCKEKFVSIGVLKRHVSDDHPNAKLITYIQNREWVCEICSVPFTQEKYLRRHLLVVHPDDIGKNGRFHPDMFNKDDFLEIGHRGVECTICGDNFPKMKDYQNHMQNDHIQSIRSKYNEFLESTKIYRCRHCHRKQSNKEYMWKHMRKFCKWKYRLDCRGCSEKFQNKEELENHKTKCQAIKYLEQKFDKETDQGFELQEENKIPKHQKITLYHVCTATKYKDCVNVADCPINTDRQDRKKARELLDSFSKTSKLKDDVQTDKESAQSIKEQLPKSSRSNAGDRISSDMERCITLTIKSSNDNATKKTIQVQIPDADLEKIKYQHSDKHLYSGSEIIEERPGCFVQTKHPKPVAIFQNLTFSKTKLNTAENIIVSPDGINPNLLPLLVKRLNDIKQLEKCGSDFPIKIRTLNELSSSDFDCIKTVSEEQSTIKSQSCLEENSGQNDMMVVKHESNNKDIHSDYDRQPNGCVETYIPSDIMTDINVRIKSEPIETTEYTALYSRYDINDKSMEGNSSHSLDKMNDDEYGQKHAMEGDSGQKLEKSMEDNNGRENDEVMEDTSGQKHDDIVEFIKCQQLAIENTLKDNTHDIFDNTFEDTFQFQMPGNNGDGTCDANSKINEYILVKTEKSMEDCRDHKINKFSVDQGSSSLEILRNEVENNMNESSDRITQPENCSLNFDNKTLVMECTEDFDTSQSKIIDSENVSIKVEIDSEHLESTLQSNDKIVTNSDSLVHKEKVLREERQVLPKFIGDKIKMEMQGKNVILCKLTKKKDVDSVSGIEKEGNGKTNKIFSFDTGSQQKKQLLEFDSGKVNVCATKFKGIPQKVSDQRPNRLVNDFETKNEKLSEEDNQNDSVMGKQNQDINSIMLNMQENENDYKIGLLNKNPVQNLDSASNEHDKIEQLNENLDKSSVSYPFILVEENCEKNSAKAIIPRRSSRLKDKTGKEEEKEIQHEPTEPIKKQKKKDKIKKSKIEKVRSSSKKNSDGSGSNRLKNSNVINELLDDKQTEKSEHRKSSATSNTGNQMETDRQTNKRKSVTVVYTVSKDNSHSGTSPKKMKSELSNLLVRCSLCRRVYGNEILLQNHLNEWHENLIH